MPVNMSLNRKKMNRSRISSQESSSSSTSSSQISSSSDEETDAKDMKPIKEYLSNRKELASQLFKSVKAEKIRMMLPQLLKKVELSELEELCVAELSGMSKTRIMCIINGQEMLQSSDTDDTDDSAPSLEIISDTEWLSEIEANVKLEGANLQNNKNKNKFKKSQNVKKQNLKSKIKIKRKKKLENDDNPNIKVKLEKMKIETKEKKKEKEGESLLDLLELEMRARAIRALIRKEEDTSSNSKSKHIESNNSSNTASGSGTIDEKNIKARQANLKEQLEKIDVLMKHGDDEDVFVVIQPAPTIELLSSDSEVEDSAKRINQKFVTERKSESEQISENDKPIKNKEVDKGKEVVLSEQKNNIEDTNKDKDTNKQNSKNETNKATENLHISSNLPISVIESCINDNSQTSHKSSENVDLEEGEILDNDDEVFKVESTVVNNTSTSTSKIKKVKKNPHIRSRKKIKENNDTALKSNTQNLANEIFKSNIEKNHKKKEKVLEAALQTIEIKDSPERNIDSQKILGDKPIKNASSPSLDMFDEKSLDIEEIINLDDYPDDMDDLEINESNDKRDIDKVVTVNDLENVKIPFNSETWATRYYQQDHVQNVIKESKIQSEIRKRLRERQRQKKMNQSPKIKDQEVSQSSSEPSVVKPTGSVEEYLALKGISNDTINNTPQENTETSGFINLTKKDDSLAICDLNLATEKDNSFMDHSEITKKNLASTHIYDSDQQVIITKKPKLCNTSDDVDSLENTCSNKTNIITEVICVNSKIIPLKEEKITVQQDMSISHKKIRVVNTFVENNLEFKVNSENVILNDVDLPLIEDQVILSTELNRTEDTCSKIDLLPLRGDVSLPKSDSSDDDGVTVRIDNVHKSKLLLQESNKIESEQKDQDCSNTKSDLQPD